MGDYFDIDPVIVRIIWVALVFGAGFGLLAYIIAWLIVPEGSYVEPKIEGPSSQ
jgi:phage shock protein PspC (stress-responsive transcriptional regulator)